MKVYISGPITGKPGLNKQAFSDAEYELEICLGYKTINPHIICRYIKPGSSWREYMRVCIAELCECDGIYLLPGWIFSRGARIEYIIAKILGLDTIRI